MSDGKEVDILRLFSVSLTGNGRLANSDDWSPFQAGQFILKCSIQRRSF